MLALNIIGLLAIIYFNGFFIGKMIKKNIRSLNFAKYITFGVVSFFGILTVSFFPLLLFNISLRTLQYYLLILQIILVMFYAINWKWLFSTLNFNWRDVLLYFIILSGLIIGGLLSIKMATFDLAAEISHVDVSALKISESGDSLIFKPGSNFTSLTFFDRFMLAMVNLLNVTDKQNLKTFIWVSTRIVFFGLGAFICFNVFNNCNNPTTIKNFILNFIFALFISLVIFFLNSSHVMENIEFVFMISLLLIWIHNLDYQTIPSFWSIIFINLTTLMGICFNFVYVILAIAINFIYIGMSYKNKKENATNYNIFVFFSSLVGLTWIVSNINYLSVIIFILICIIYIFYGFFRTSNMGRSFLQKADNFFYAKINYFIFTIAIMAFFISLIIFFVSDYAIVLKPWILSEMLPPSFTTIEWLRITANTLFVGGNVILFLICVLVTTKSTLFKNKNTVKGFNLILLVFILFWNPFAINILYNLTQSLAETITIELNWQFMFLPIFFLAISFLCNYCITQKQMNAKLYLYNGFLLSAIVAITTAINVL